MSNLTIQQWYARAVAAGLMPDWSDVWTRCITHNEWILTNLKNDIEEELRITGYIKTKINCGKCEECESVGNFYNHIQLRKDWVDLVELWTKEDIPTEKNIGEMCWFKFNLCDTMIYGQLTGLGDYYEFEDARFDYCLLATNGNIAPKPEDFRKAYSE